MQAVSANLSLALTGPRAARGVTLIELLVVLMLLGLAMGASKAAWNNYRQAASVDSAATLVKLALQQARLLSVYRNVNHFVVVDPASRSVAVFEDSSAPNAEFDSGDTLVSQVTWPDNVQMALPAEPTPLTNPLANGNLSSSWELPLPDTSGAWGTRLRGVMTTPRGQILSAAATPLVIGTGTIVLSDSDGVGRTASIGMIGLSGSVHVYRHDGTDWTQL